MQRMKHDTMLFDWLELLYVGELLLLALALLAFKEVDDDRPLDDGVRVTIPSGWNVLSVMVAGREPLSAARFSFMQHLEKKISIKKFFLFANLVRSCCSRGFVLSPPMTYKVEFTKTLA